MAFNPSSTIYLCNVPIDNTYQHQLTFVSKEAQYQYFLSRVVRQFSDYLTVRKTLPDGSLQSSVKVGVNIDDLYGCNYMFYQNANHGTKWFYAFIENLIYINEGTTEIVFETDVYQTWVHDVEFKPSYVVREHSITDEIGDNLVPENINVGDYKYLNWSDDHVDLGDWGVLVTSSIPHSDAFNGGWFLSGIYQGLYFYFFKSPAYVNRLIDKLEKEKEGAIVSLTFIPEICVKGYTSNTGCYDADGNIVEADGEGMVQYSYTPNSKTFQLNINEMNLVTDSGKEYKNKKLYTSPFYNLVITNGETEVAYNIEDFSNRNLITFTVAGDVTVNPSVMLYPHNYKGVSKNMLHSISLSPFPQCSYNGDSFKMWLARNTNRVATTGVASLASLVGGLALMATGAGAGAGAIMLSSGTTAGLMATGGSLAVSGATGVISTFNTVNEASHNPNDVQGGGSSYNLLTALKENKFKILWRFPKKDYAQTLDDYFTKYGYQTNKLKVPNFNSRPYFNYVKTIDIDITGGIPDRDMKRLKQIFNNGVTLWHRPSYVCNYSVDNSPSNVG